MAYRKYNSKLLEENLGLKVQKTNLFKDCTIPKVETSQRLKLILEAYKVLNLTTEKAVSEQLIAPILTEIRLNNENVVDFYSGEQLNVDASKDLNGEIDFLFTKANQT